MKRYLCIISFFVMLCAIACYGERYDLRTQDLVNVLLGLTPEDNCIYGHFERGTLVIVKVIKGRGVVCAYSKQFSLKTILIETNKEYADGDILSAGVYCYLGIAQYEDIFKDTRTVRSFRELEGKDAEKYRAQIFAEIKEQEEERARLIQAKKDEEKKRFAEEQLSRKTYYRFCIDSQSLAISNIVVVAPTIKKYVKKATVDDDLWRAVQTAVQSDDWLPVIRLCPSNGWRGGKNYEVYPDRNELLKCAEMLRRVEVPLVLMWNDKVPRFEIIEYDLNSGSLECCSVEEIKKGWAKVGCRLKIQLGKKYFICPVGGSMRLQKRLQKQMSYAESDIKNLQGAECDEQYAKTFRKFFFETRKQILQGKFFSK